MKNTILFLMFLASSFAFAQVQTPQPSPSAQLSQTVGLTEVTVKYSRPSKKDRDIFGALVPFGKIWRTGANQNTIISFFDAVTIGDLSDVAAEIWRARVHHVNLLEAPMGGGKTTLCNALISTWGSNDTGSHC